MRNRMMDCVVIGAASVFVMVLSGCHGDEKVREQKDLPPVSVSLASVKLMEIPQYIDAPGTISAQFKVDVSTRVSGRIASVNVKQGDRIRRGELLLSLDTRDLDAGVAQTESELAASDASYNGASNSEKMAKLSTSAQIDSAYAQIDQAKAALASSIARRDEVYAGPRKQVREQARQNVARADAALELARKTYNRMDSLYKVEAITAQQHDVAKSDLDSAQAAYNSAIQNNKLVDEGARIEDKHAADDAVKQAEAALKQAQAALDQAKAGAIQGSVKRAEMAQAQAMISKAKAARAIALVNRSYAAVNAPFDGVVSDRLADPGAMAGPGVPLLKVEGGLLQIDASVPESLVSHLAVGTNVSVSTDALQSKSIPARVLSISPQGDPGSHTFLVKANLPSGAPIKSGMYARMRIKTGESRAIMVPFDAVVDREGLNYVYVASNGVAQLRLVTVGGTENGLCSLLSGVQSGEKVIISNMARISDNMPISEAK